MERIRDAARVPFELDPGSLFMTPEDDREFLADSNPRGCVIFADTGYHVYSRIDGCCADCAKPNPRRTDNGL